MGIVTDSCFLELTSTRKEAVKHAGCSILEGISDVGFCFSGCHPVEGVWFTHTDITLRMCFLSSAFPLRGLPSLPGRDSGWRD